MSGGRAAGILALGVALSTSALHAQTAAQYRDFQLGGNLASISALTRVAVSEAKTMHTRPALLQEMQWRRPFVLSTETTADPVKEIAFSFYNDQLFRMVIDYDRDRTAGMTDEDMIEAVSTMYGKPLGPTAKATRVPMAVSSEDGTRLAGWGSDDYAATLYRASYATGFRMVITSIKLNALARTAEAEAVRLDAREAPQRERERQQKEAEDARTSEEKARLANKAAFKP